jgi:hypothetical protein
MRLGTAARQPFFPLSVPFEKAPAVSTVLEQPRRVVCDTHALRQAKEEGTLSPMIVLVLELVLERACGVRRGASGRWRSGRIEYEFEEEDE